MFKMRLVQVVDNGTDDYEDDYNDYNNNYNTGALILSGIVICMGLV